MGLARIGPYRLIESDLVQLDLQALRRGLDMSSGDPRARLVSVGLALVGALLVFSGRVEGLLAYAIIVWSNPGHWIRLLSGVLDRWPGIAIALPMMVVAIGVAQMMPFPIDDLLRHIARSAWPNGYVDMYVHTSLPPFELYPTFDRLVGAMAHLVGPMAAARMLMVLAWGLFVVVFLCAARRSIGSRADWAFWASGAMILVLAEVGVRLTLARPEIFVGIWALCALCVRGPLGIVVWALAGVMLGTGYWLSPIYFVLAAMLPGSWRRRLLVFGVMCLAWLGLWFAITGDYRFENYRWAATVLTDRHPELSVGENASIVKALGHPWMLAVFVGVVWAWRRPGADNRMLMLSAFFACSNQLRYVSMIAPLLALYVLGAISRRMPPLSMRQRVVSLAALLFAAPIVGNWLPRLSQMPRFDLPRGAVVFTAFGPATYSTLFFNAGKARVAPGFEVGAASPRVQQLVLELTRGKADCGELASLGFTHLVESTLGGRPPSCLELLEVQAGWRLWRVSAGP